jgi:hypothetical protein
MDALDIKYAIAVTSHRLEVRAGTSADTRGSDILVVTASEAMGAGLDLSRSTAEESVALPASVTSPAGSGSQRRTAPSSKRPRPGSSRNLRRDGAQKVGMIRARR